MKQFKTILKFELKDYFKNKSFVGITLFLVLAISAVMFLPRITETFGDGGEDKDSQRAIMLLSVREQGSEDVVFSTFCAYFPQYDVRITGEDEEAIKTAVTEGDAECAFVLDAHGSYTYYVDNLSVYDPNTATANAALTDVYRTLAMVNGGISAEAASAIMSMNVTGETVSLGKDQAKNFFYTYIMNCLNEFMCILN